MNPRNILLAPYHVTRVPLSVLDATVAPRLPEDSAPRIFIDKAIGSFDQTAGRLLSNEAITQQGTDRLERAAKLTKAVALEKKAVQTRDDAAAVADSGRRKAAQQAQKAKDRVDEALSEAERTEQEGKQRAAEQARELAAKKKKQAAARKQQQQDAVQQRLKNAESNANAKLSKAQQAAKAELDDSAQKRAGAAEKRDAAHQLSELTNAKRQARTQT